jgi:hypothetical protein
MYKKKKMLESFKKKVFKKKGVKKNLYTLDMNKINFS